MQIYPIMTASTFKGAVRFVPKEQEDTEEKEGLTVFDTDKLNLRDVKKRTYLNYDDEICQDIIITLSDKNSGDSEQLTAHHIGLKTFFKKPLTEITSQYKNAQKGDSVVDIIV